MSCFIRLEDKSFSFLISKLRSHMECPLKRPECQDFFCVAHYHIPRIQKRVWCKEGAWWILVKLTKIHWNCLASFHLALGAGPLQPNAFHSLQPTMSPLNVSCLYHTHTLAFNLLRLYIVPCVLCVFPPKIQATGGREYIFI